MSVTSPVFPQDVWDKIIASAWENEKWTLETRRATLLSFSLVDFSSLVSSRRRLWSAYGISIGETKEERGAIRAYDENIGGLLGLFLKDPCLSGNRKAQGYPPLASHIHKITFFIGFEPASARTINYLSILMPFLGQVNDVKFLYRSCGTPTPSLSGSGILPVVLPALQRSSVHTICASGLADVPVTALVSFPSLKSLEFEQISPLWSDAPQESAPNNHSRPRTMFINGSPTFITSLLELQNAKAVFSRVEEIETVAVGLQKGPMLQLLDLCKRTLRTLRISAHLPTPFLLASLCPQEKPRNGLDLSRFPSLTTLIFDIENPAFGGLHYTTFTPLWSILKHVGNPTVLETIELRLVDGSRAQPFQGFHPLCAEEWQKFDAVLTSFSFPRLKALRINLKYATLQSVRVDGAGDAEYMAQVAHYLKTYLFSVLQRVREKKMLSLRMEVFLEEWARRTPPSNAARPVLKEVVSLVERV